MIRKLVRFLLPRSILMAVGGTLMNMIVIQLVGSLGTVAVATYSASQNFLSYLLSLLSWVIMGGLVCSAIHQEEGNREKGKRIHKRALLLSMLLLIAAHGAMFFFPQQLMQLYVYPEEIIASGIGYMRAFSIASLLFSFLFLIIGQCLRTHSYASVLVPGIVLLLSGLVLMPIGVFEWRLGLEYIGFIQGALQAVVYILPFVFIPVKLYDGAFLPAQAKEEPQQPALPQ